MSVLVFSSRNFYQILKNMTAIQILMLNFLKVPKKFLIMWLDIFLRK